MGRQSTMAKKSKRHLQKRIKKNEKQMRKDIAFEMKIGKGDFNRPTLDDVKLFNLDKLSGQALEKRFHEVRQQNYKNQVSMQKKIHNTTLNAEQWTNGEKWAAIKKYNELVKRGVIKKTSILDNYEIVQFMEDFLSSDEYAEFAIQALQKDAELDRKDEIRRQQRTQSRAKRFSNYEGR